MTALVGQRPELVSEAGRRADVKLSLDHHDRNLVVRLDIPAQRLPGQPGPAHERRISVAVSRK
jgi:hypothetical protein